MTPSDASPNRWSDLDRPPLNVPALRRGLLRPGGLWTSLDVVDVTGSTNTDLAARAAELTEGTVLVAEEQTAGRGRLDRSWTAPARSGLFFSVYLTPGDDVPVHRWGWLPLLAGVATATGLARAAGVDTALKWPNDLLVTVEGEERKTGGILAERAGDGVVIGIGLNVTLRADELPAPTAASLALADAVSTDRETLLRGVLRSLDHWYVEWRAAGGDAAQSGLQAAYAAGCATLGRRVRAQMPGDRSLVGEAVAIDGDGRLILSTADGVQEPVSAGDIVHLRDAEGGLT
ncbi:MULTISPECIES: biotin--[acetyl-CoA-carboxylase] ligase [Streptomyces]|jgi:BirA family biotin operon repressor/biotin-[acetyl-CoA-carboxylase] ligase|uniref:biotin--[acetyl-CoA-carboxylase] ligase n=1 Tax=unclassified Streptomyces TaxID=2593676 RepID=UPI000880EFE2|nr:MULTISPECIES: biotin--[acetyl-CoA-carboxylase] ligase [unclassified Streptomyces]MDX2727547.1 biotin--[acetyl-CoA-carboxylase] ligase [Streptomyces sp. PA03-2a]MDX3764960.1 biotin--[acetyl-CoA-carboxylase] ligase [Streptomyces sp. AK08-01B]MDX3814539.1 biotin--[acetyl-CoA-carboxylase] ligase [Streptomyces sp. AK08-01A]SCY59366.1 BirA family transcriptional regulator, biotin operon repressor / biotin-[acetyl-CoA-carboxylase] ligase [Streptomyces sp. 136MFCol5.1]SFT25928.1 BirA family transcr